MAAPSLPTVPEVQYENMTGEQLAADLAVLTGRLIEEIKNEGVQATPVSLHLTEKLPEGRPDLGDWRDLCPSDPGECRCPGCE